MAHDNNAPVIDPVKTRTSGRSRRARRAATTRGQDLVITAPVVALPLVRLILKHAYKAGAGVVTPFFSDDAIALARYENAPDREL